MHNRESFLITLYMRGPLLTAPLASDIAGFMVPLSIKLNSTWLYYRRLYKLWLRVRIRVRFIIGIVGALPVARLLNA
ncbi:hypothetical protein V2W45_1433093 [Cenococcum geophilum]